MKRRRVLVGVAGLGALAGCLSESDDGGDGGDEESASDEQPSFPLEIETLDAPGSEAGTMTVPQPAGVTVVNFTRSRCPTSEGYLDRLGGVRDELDRDDVHFLSIIHLGRDPTDREDLPDWWADFGGEWALGVDETGNIFRGFDGMDTPAAMIVDTDGEIRWHYVGTARSDEIREAIEDALGES